jgi:hypothetical protein
MHIADRRVRHLVGARNHPGLNRRGWQGHSAQHRRHENASHQTQHFPVPSSCVVTTPVATLNASSASLTPDSRPSPILRWIRCIREIPNFLPRL